VLAENPDDQVLKTILDFNPTFPSTEYGDYTSAIGRAINYPDGVLARWLLDHGADPEHSIGPLWTPLWRILEMMSKDSSSRGLETVQRLLKHGARVSSYNVKQAVMGEQEECLELLTQYPKQVQHDLEWDELRDKAFETGGKELVVLVDALWKALHGAESKSKSCQIQ
jgi:hypothetical protein